MEGMGDANAIGVEVVCLIATRVFFFLISFFLIPSYLPDPAVHIFFISVFLFLACLSGLLPFTFCSPLFFSLLCGLSFGTTKATTCHVLFFFNVSLSYLRILSQSSLNPSTLYFSCGSMLSISHPQIIHCCSQIWHPQTA